MSTGELHAALDRLDIKIDRVVAQRDALADALDKAMCTFRDIAIANGALGRVPLAQACNIAADYCEAALREAGLP